jgi:hypothetical protein
LDPNFQDVGRFVGTFNFTELPQQEIIENVSELQNVSELPLQEILEEVSELPQQEILENVSASAPNGSRRMQATATGEALTSSFSERPVTVTALAPPLAQGSGAPRRLADMKLAHVTKDVTVIWGILVREPPVWPDSPSLFLGRPAGQSWGFDSFFEPSDPWVQRAMMKMCQLPVPSGLRAEPEDTASGGPWPYIFEAWLGERGYEYPSRDFHNDIQQFLEEYGVYQKDFLLDGGLVRAARIGFNLQLPDNPSVNEVEDVRNAWEDYVQARNDESGLRARRAWQTSQLWSLLEARTELRSGVWWGIFISLIFGCLSTGLATWSLQLTAVTFISSLCILAWQVFFISAIMHWSFGIVEALVTIIFTGYGFTLNFHVVLAYRDASVGAEQNRVTPEAEQEDLADLSAEDRKRRVRCALVAAGPAVLCDSATMVGSSFFMLFGMLEFHRRFGAVTMFLSIASLLHTLLLVPLLLLRFGPTPHDRSCQRLGAVLRGLLPGRPGNLAAKPDADVSCAVAPELAPLPPPLSEPHGEGGGWGVRDPGIKSITAGGEVSAAGGASSRAKNAGGPKEEDSVTV